VFDGFTLRVHFLLWGSYRIDERREGSAERLALGFPNGELNLYSSSLKFLEGDLDELYDWGADVMSDAWDPKAARRKLRAMPDTLVADALLDQDVFAGVGNIIKNEVLFRTRVHPESTVGSIPPRTLGKVIADARTYSEAFLAWKKAGTLRQHWQVHTKRTCPCCGGPLSKTYPGRSKRRTFFCPNCQVKY
jgi:endonuclease-8